MSFNVFRENITLAEISGFTVGTEYFTGCFCLFEVLYPSQQLWSVHLTWHSLLFEAVNQYFLHILKLLVTDNNPS